MPKFTKYEHAHLLFSTFVLLVEELCALEKLEHKSGRGGGRVRIVIKEERTVERERERIRLDEVKTVNTFRLEFSRVRGKRKEEKEKEHW